MRPDAKRAGLFGQETGWHGKTFCTNRTVIKRGGYPVLEPSFSAGAGFFTLMPVIILTSISSGVHWSLRARASLVSLIFPGL